VVAGIGALIEKSGRNAADRDVREGRPPADPAQLMTRRNRSIRLVLLGAVGGTFGVLAAAAVATVSVPVAVAVALVAAAGGTAGLTVGAARAVRSQGHLRRLRELAAQGRLGPPQAQRQGQGVGLPGIGFDRPFPDPRLVAMQTEWNMNWAQAFQNLARMGFYVRASGTNSTSQEFVYTDPDGRQYRQSWQSTGDMNFGASPGQPPPRYWNSTRVQPDPPRPGGRRPRMVIQQPPELPGPAGDPDDDRGH
jgi:hypothetical protein